MLSLLLVSCSDSVAPVYEGSSVKILKSHLTADLEKEFSRQSYRLDDLAGGVPPLILQSMPKDLPEISSSQRKKKIFFKSLLPMILLANNEVRREREQLLELHKLSSNGKKFSESQLRNLTEMAERYKVDSSSESLEETSDGQRTNEKRKDSQPTT